MNYRNFKIREKYDFRNFNGVNSSKVEAEYESDKGSLKIKTQIHGMEIIPFLLRAIILLIYFLLMFITLLELLLMLFSSDAKHMDGSMMLGPLILSIFAYFLIYSPYKAAKNNIIEMKNDIELIYQLIEKMPYNTI